MNLPATLPTMALLQALFSNNSIEDEMSDIVEYVVWSNEHSAWWGANRAGYYTHLSSAGRYTRDEAVAICWGARGGREFNRNPSEVPILLKDAEAFWTEEGLEEQRRREHREYMREMEAEEAALSGPKP
jgi:hypothetical protein